MQPDRVFIGVRIEHRAERHEQACCIELETRGGVARDNIFPVLDAGSLNYLKLKKDNTWAWPPMVFLNSVEKVQKMLEAMAETHTTAEMECFDVGIVRSVGLYLRAGMAKEMHYNFVMGVASGMPCDPELLELLMKLRCGWWFSTVVSL